MKVGPELRIVLQPGGGSPYAYGMMRMLELLREAKSGHDTFKAFSDMEEALTWLSVKDPAQSILL